MILFFPYKPSLQFLNQQDTYIRSLRDAKREEIRVRVRVCVCLCAAGE